MVWESNPGRDEIFRPLPDLSWSPPSLQYNGYRVSFPGAKRPGRGVEHLATRLQEEDYAYYPALFSWQIIE